MSAGLARAGDPLARLERALRALAAERRPALVLVEAPPRELAQAWRAFGRAPRWLWDPPGAPALVGGGVAYARFGDDPAQSFDESALAPLSGALVVAESARRLPSLRLPLFVACAFPGRVRDGSWLRFARAMAVLPELVYARDAEGRAALGVALAGDESAARLDERLARAAALLGRLEDPPAAVEAPPALLARVEESSADFARRVLGAKEAIARGALSKVVLARRTTLRLARPLAPASLIARLTSGPGFWRFALEPEPGALFAGSTPERLVARAGTRVESEALAGTQALSGAQSDLAAAERAAAALAASTKDLEEHRFVVEALAAGLAPLCEKLDVAPAPTPRVLPHLVHLSSPLVGRLAQPAGALTIARALMPTPAVGGTPREAALAFLDEHEPFERGLYAGALGLVEPGGDGEITVPIRSAQVAGERVHVYAGAGIVAASDPEREYEETAGKMARLLDALGIDG